MIENIWLWLGGIEQFLMGLSTAQKIWFGLGLVAQGLFFSRFFVQWLASERAGKSVVPALFWYLSISGATLLLAYSIYREDPVFIIGQTCGVLIYTRNLWLIRREKLQSAAF